MRREFFSGIKAELPILIGVIPFGMIYGVLALSAGILPGQAQAMSTIIFAGSAQFITAQLVSSGAPSLVIILTVGVVNLRHALYSVSIAPFLKSIKPAWKCLLAYLLTDEAYAVSIVNYTGSTRLDEATLTPSNPGGICRDGSDPVIQLAPDQKHWFFLGAGLALWSSWQLSTAAGIFLGAVVPESWSLDFTLALTFIALFVPLLKDRPTLAAALLAGVTAVVTYHFPYKLGLLCSALVGILAGLWLEGKR